MCIVIWTTQSQLGYRLILASNRDEFLNRRSLPAHWHSFEPIDRGGIHTGEDEEQQQEILSGRDAVAGGTWLGIHKRTGKFGILTNVNGQLDEVVRPKDQPPTLASRGLIIQQFLQSDDGVQSYINKLKSNPTSHLMNGYNLVLGQMGNDTKAQDGSGVAFFCNRDPEDRDNLFGLMGNNMNQALPSASSSSSSCESTRVYAVSNGIANQPPIWPKVSLAIHAMQDCLKHASRGPHSDQPVDQTRLEMDLFKLLSQTNETTEEVPSNIMVRPHHRHGSEDRSESIETWYGTRTQTILLVSDTVPTKITLVERDAFQIHSSSHPPLASPVWVGDDQSRWRRFQFFLSS